MVNKSNKGLVGALALATALNGAPAFAAPANSDKIKDNLYCSYGAPEASGFFNGLAHGFAVNNLSDEIAVKVVDGGVVKYSPSTALCSYKGNVGLAGIMTDSNGTPLSQYSLKGLEAVKAQETKAYLVGGAIILGISAAAGAAAAGGSSSGSAAPIGGGTIGGF